MSLDHPEDCKCWVCSQRRRGEPEDYGKFMRELVDEKRLDSTGSKANAEKDARIAELEALFQNIWLNIENRDTLDRLATLTVKGIIASALDLAPR